MKMSMTDIEALYNSSNLVWQSLTYEEDHFDNWGNGAFIGNGMLGASVYKKTADGITFELGRNDAEAHNHLKGIDWTVPRIPIGDLKLILDDGHVQESMEMELYRAVVSGRIIGETSDYRWQAFCDAARDIMVIKTERLSGERPLEVLRIPQYGVSPRLSWLDNDIVKNATPLPPMYEEKTCDVISGWVQPLINDDGELDGGVAVAVLCEGDGNTDIYYISITHSRHTDDYWENAVMACKQAQAVGFDRIFSEHTGSWERFYSKSTVVIPDEYWQKFYNIQMYKLGSATREDACQVIDCQGPWLTKTGWPGTWWNLNVQLSYSPMYTSNHLETARSLINTLVKYEEQLRKNAEPLVPDGMYIHRASGREMTRNNIPTYEQIFSGNLVCFELGNLTWIMYMVYRHYKHSMDFSILSGVLYPMLQATVNVYLKLLYYGDDGKLHLPKTTSPEYPGPKNHNGNTYPSCDASYDLALLRWALDTLIRLSDKVSVSDAYLEKLKKALTELAPLPIDENGIMVADGLPFEVSHRHYSHLLAFYPLHQLDMDIPEQRELAERSMKHWMGITGRLQGYSFTGSACMAATLEDGEQAYGYLNGLKDYLLPNTMYIERVGGPVIETPLSAAESVQYMLMQSYNETVKIFPAVPKEWADVSFENLLAEGAFEVSACRRGGRTCHITVKSLAGQPLVIKPNMDGNITITGVDKERISRIGNGFWKIYTSKGDIVTFSEGK